MTKHDDHGASGAADATDLASFALEIPYPMLRADRDGTLVFVNEASQLLLSHWQTQLGQRLPETLVANLQAALDEGERRRLEQTCGDRLFRIVFHPIVGAGYCNLYALDITDQRAFEDRVGDLARFPDENPNPVMRVGLQGKVMYANEAAQLVLDWWGIGDRGVVPTDVFDQVRQAVEAGSVWRFEVATAEAIYGFEIVAVVESGYANLYGRDITLQKEAERFLTDARDGALQASRAKSAFLANMSHELRTPMNAIIGYSEMLLEEAESRGLDDLSPDLRRIHAAGRHLLDLINDVLDLSKIEAGRMELYLEQLDLEELTRRVQDTVQPLAATNDNGFAVELEPGLPTMRTDGTKLRQVLLNLLSNAFKFTRAGRVTLRVRREPDAPVPMIAFEVQDTGIGMTPEQARRIYSSFTQADDSTTREFGGTGLGLTITRRFCEMLGGDIALSTVPGQGSTFTVTLPVETQRLSERPPRPDPSAPSSVIPGPGVGKHPVLVVDDDPNVRDLLRATLSKVGFGVVTAANGEEALKLAREIEPTAITLDVIMPGMDGWSVLSRLKSDPATQDIPVVLATISDDKNLGFALGATEFMTKPIDRKRLVDVLQKLRYGKQSCSLLVVEDDVETRELMRRSLEKVGWTVNEAGDGRQGLARLEEVTPDVVVLDLMMPEMNGFQFLRQLRADSRFRELPVIVVTARDLSPDERTFLRGNVERVLKKGELPRDALLGEVCDAVLGTIAPPINEVG